MIRCSAKLAVLLVLTVHLGCTGTSDEPRGAGESPDPSQKAASEGAAASIHLRDGRYLISSSDGLVSASAVPEGGFAARGDDWDFVLRVASIGRTAPAATTLTWGSVRSTERSLWYDRGIATEWFVANEGSIEHGFDFEKRAPGKGPLVVRMRLESGTLTPALTQDRRTLQFLDGTRLVASYAGLTAVDARGAAVPAHFELRGASLNLVVADSEAHYPLVIDPVIRAEGTVVGSDVTTGASYGTAVAVAGDELAVGAPGDSSGAGAVYVHRRNQSGNNSWGQVQKLVPTGVATGHAFGSSVALRGDTLVAGAPGDGAGAAYVFLKSAGTWTFHRKLAPSSGAAGDDFGRSVATDGSFVTVGAPGADTNQGTNSGSVHLFERSRGGTDNFGFAKQLLPPAATASAALGSSMAAFGDWLVVGAPGTGAGAAFVYGELVPTGGGDFFALVATLAGSDTASGDRFGASVAITTDEVVVGAPDHGTGGGAYLYSRNVGGTNAFGFVKKLTASTSSGDDYGASVAIALDAVLVGAPGADAAASNAGAVFGFVRDEGGTGNWGFSSTHAPSSTADAALGTALGLSGYEGFAGAPADGGGLAHRIVINVPPTAVNDSFTMQGNSTLTIAAPGVLTNDVDPNFDALTATLLTSPAGGTFSFNADGSFTFTPVAGFTGTDSFTYEAADPAETSAPATVTITVEAFNQSPSANADATTTAEDTLVAIDVLANDTDPESDSLSVLTVTNPPNGSAAIANGLIEYTPDPNFNGMDTFSYTATDGTTNAATNVTVTVTPVNDPPTPVNDFVLVNEDTSDNAVDVLANDTDVDGDAPTIDSVGTPANGTARVSGGQVLYTPYADFFGVDSVDYAVRDPDGATATATVSVGVNAVKDPPVANDDSATTMQGTAVLIPVLANDTDPDQDPLTIAQIAPTPNGVATIMGSEIEYVPNLMFVGTETFTYTVTDGAALFDTATVTVTVTSLNLSPSFVPPTPVGTVRGTAGARVAFVVQATDPDASDVVAYALQNPPMSSTFDTTTGAFEWFTTPSDSGTHMLRFQATDGRTTVDRTVTVELAFVDNDNDDVDDDFERGAGLDPTSPDSDGDNIADIDEIGPDISAAVDTDGDQTIDALDNDSDGDGVADLEEAGDTDLATPPVDTDDDDVPDYRDTDSDDDGITDGGDNCPRVRNGQEDLDQDEIGDLCDPDRDGDGIPNDLEQSLGLDPNNIDSDGDTIRDGHEIGSTADPFDSDEDGMIDALDDDSDADGLSDADEAGDADPNTPPVDTDGDGIHDYRDTDSDDDTVLDGDDNCRLVANTNQADRDDNGVGDLCDAPASNDADGDGVLDGPDNCPDVANPDQADADGDLVGDACDDDSDNDQIVDGEDNCPLLSNPNQADADEDRIGDACDDDGDNDGIADADDNCPEGANPDQADEDDDGKGDACEESVVAPPGPRPEEKEGCCRVAAGSDAPSRHITLALMFLAAVLLRRR